MGAGASAEEFDYDAELQKEPKIVYTTEVKDDGDNKMEGCGPIRRHYKFPDRLVTEPFPEGKNSQEKATTLWWSFQKGLSLAPDNNCLGSRKFVEGKRTDYAWLSYKQVDAEVRDVAAGLASIGVKPKDKIGICGANRPEWTMTGLANYSSNLVTIALYDTLGADALDYIINHAEVRVAFCAPEKTKAIFGILEKCPNLKHVVQFDAHPAFNNVQDAVKEDERKSFADKGVELLGFSELKARGQANNNFKPVPPAEKDIAFIMYTSGTTGVPKGVVLRHESIMASIAGLVQVVQLRSSDVHISYLPLAHILETAVQAGVLCFGASIGFYSGDPRQIMDDIKLLQPTIFPGVPRIFSRIWDKVQSNLRNANCVGRTIFTKCYNGQQYNVRRGLPYNKSYENFFASKVRPNLGLQKCRLVVTGAAPCPPFLMEFLKIVINPKDGVLQGFGMTETSAGISITDPADHTFGQVGPPIPAIEVRLRDVPEMNYFANANPPKGEILVRGMGVFSGYYKMDDATKEVLSDDGWLSTGDVGRWNPNGTLSIIDRKKNIFKLSHGEYIAAEKIENVYGKCPLVGQVFVYGNSYKPFIVGVVVPNVENTMRLLQDKGLWQGPPKLANTPEFRAAFKAEVEKHYDVTVAAIMADLSSEGKKKNLLGFEIVKDITLELELDEVFNGFTIANDCLTPTFKLRRPFLLKRYEPKIRALYEKNGEKCLPSEKWS